MLSTFTMHSTLALLLRVLQAHRQSCTLWAQLPSGASMRRSQEPCQAELVVMEGEVKICLISDLKSGRRLADGRIALDLLAHHEPLTWVIVSEGQASSPSYRASLHPDEPHTMSTEHSREFWSQHPARLHTPPSPSEREALPHRVRQVFLLIDGRRVLPDFVRVLSSSPDQLASILDQLAERGWIR